MKYKSQDIRCGAHELAEITLQLSFAGIYLLIMYLCLKNFVSISTEIAKNGIHTLSISKDNATAVKLELQKRSEL
jgi:hypothetical protein